MIRVLAMSPSGEAYFTRDHRGQVWEHHRMGGLDPVRAGDQVVDRVVLDHGYERVDENAATFAEAEDLVERRTARASQADLPVNRTVARSMIPVLDGWLLSPADRCLVIPLVTRLLAADEVALDAELRRELLQRVERASGADPPAPVRMLGSNDTRASASRFAVTLQWFEPTAA